MDHVGVLPSYCSVCHVLSLMGGFMLASLTVFYSKGGIYLNWVESALCSVGLFLWLLDIFWLGSSPMTMTAIIMVSEVSCGACCIICWTSVTWALSCNLDVASSHVYHIINKSKSCFGRLIFVNKIGQCFPSFELLDWWWHFMNMGLGRF